MDLLHAARQAVRVDPMGRVSVEPRVVVDWLWKWRGVKREEITIREAVAAMPRPGVRALARWMAGDAAYQLEMFTRFFGEDDDG